MSKKVYVSADWKEPFDSHSWDKEVVDRIRQWGKDSRYGIEIVCTDNVHNSVTNNNDCRRCDIKNECRSQIIKSDIIIFVIGDKTATKNAGPCDGFYCSPAYSGAEKKICNRNYLLEPIYSWKDMSYLELEITTAVLNNKPIIIVYNSVKHQNSWIPSWYTKLCKDYNVRPIGDFPFWLDPAHTHDNYRNIGVYLK